MKTTLDIPDDLLIEAKSIAAKRRTTLKAMVEHALRREIRPTSETGNPDPEKFEIGPFGILSLKRTQHPMTAEQYQYFIDHQYDEEDAKTLSVLEGKS